MELPEIRQGLVLASSSESGRARTVTCIHSILCFAEFGGECRNYGGFQKLIGVRKGREFLTHYKGVMGLKCGSNLRPLICKSSEDSRKHCLLLLKTKMSGRADPRDVDMQ
ncbi:hypothetical protein Pyn_22369 [Prunus yedoensis var. nudiflora]|uniref:Uncharacterized protein n=1 Tax=Prunus yedoensis var. nudiflora TaxID=2094558 RepID=A0A314XSU7_PRUYE|nr:hypothetical protein Pyn_22369 [Prunus yedoensis var. nudiflora]